MNVYEKALKRIEYCFNEFENVMISFSGGKDSSVMLNLCYDYAKKHNMLHKLSLMHLDYEAQYQMTTDFVDETFKRFNDIKRFWLCVPIRAPCACRMDKGYWIPWEKSKKEIWCREMPTYDYVINEDNMEFIITEYDYEPPKDFHRWFVEKYGRTVIMVGIRTQESYARKKVIGSMNGTITKFNDLNYIVDNVQHKDLYTAYPIYDWKTDDIWVCNAKFGYKYNKLYDLYYQAGLSIDQMRVASPFHDCGIHTIKLYKVIDPNNWGKLIGRVNGVNFAGLYGGTTAMGWRKITKPDHLTWKEYFYFLLSTMDEETRNHYLLKFNVSRKVWKERGGVLDKETIEGLKNENSPAIYTGVMKNDKEVIKFDDYIDDTSIANFSKIPSYKRICVCIMKNDYFCKYMGFSITKEEYEKRCKTLELYKNLI